MSGETARKLLRIVEAETPHLKAMKEGDASRKPAPGKWCPKEVLGHLVDSAANNHQRFLRARKAEELRLPAYAQDEWVRRQAYAEEPLSAIVDLWAAWNRHLAHVMARIPAEDLAAPCRIGENPPVTLEFIVKDYVRHLEHHLRQIRPDYVTPA